MTPPGGARDAKLAAIALAGKRVRFAHQPAGPYHQVDVVMFFGHCPDQPMVRLRDMSGEFAAHLFVEEGGFK